jgi:hypothetical protein
MALQKYEIEGFGQIELNQVAFRRDGRIEAQCKLDTGTDFGKGKTLEYAENGMLLAVDNIARRIRLPQDGTYPIALNYTTEHMYDERANALKDFKLEPCTFLPRLGYLSIGDKFTTNCLCYDTDDFADETAVNTALDTLTTPVYGGISTMGRIKVTPTEPTEGPVLRVIKKTTMPDGTFGLKFQVYKA